MSQPIEFIAPTPGPKTLEQAVAPEQAYQTHADAWNKVSGLLVQGEHIEHMVVQGLLSLSWHPGILALTNRRILIARPRWFSLRFTDMPWRLLADAHLAEGPAGATITIFGTHGAKFELGYLPKAGARRAYAFAQAQEEPVVEFRRQRLLEQHRAQARGVPVEAYAPQPQAPATAAPVAPSAVEPSSPVQALSALKELLDKGLIESAEYEAKKAEVLGRL